MSSFRVLASGLILSAAFGCSMQSSFEHSSPIRAPDTAPTASGSNGGDTGTGTGVGTTQTLRLIQPAIASRGVSCLACHMNVNSNVITDFGYGDPYFLDPGPGSSSNFSGSAYFNHELCAWQTAKIQGSVVVPKAMIYRTGIPDTTGTQGRADVLDTIDSTGKLNSVSLADLLRAPANTNKDCDSATVSPASMTVGVTPPAGGAAVVEKSKVYIGAPSESDILSLAPTLMPGSVTSGFAQISVAKDAPSLQGLTVMGNSTYVQNTEGAPIVCYGDVVVKGPLSLIDPIIETDDAGCRLYVTGSVFLQGGVTYSGTAATPNLQISSSRAIMLGFDSASVSRRMLLPANHGFPASDRGFILPYWYTRGAGTNQDKANAILADSLVIPNLIDADNVPSSTLSHYEFMHLLLNAPQIHSRYQLPFQGVLVGELVLFRLNEFVFRFDPVFNTTSALPALAHDVLSVTD